MVILKTMGSLRLRHHHHQLTPSLVHRTTRLRLSSLPTDCIRLTSSHTSLRLSLIPNRNRHPITAFSKQTPLTETNNLPPSENEHVSFRIRHTTATCLVLYAAASVFAGLVVRGKLCSQMGVVLVLLAGFSKLTSVAENEHILCRLGYVTDTFLLYVIAFIVRFAIWKLLALLPTLVRVGVFKPVAGKMGFRNA